MRILQWSLVAALGAVLGLPENAGMSEQRWAVAFDFAESFSAARSTGAASTEVRVDRAGNVNRTSIFQHPALQAGAPAAHLSYDSVQLPDLAEGEALRLKLYLALSDRIDLKDTPAADGCEFAVRVDGREVLRKTWSKQEWFEWTHDLTPYAGKTVAVVFEVGGRANSQADWALWGEPRVEIVGRPWKPREGPKSRILALEALSARVVEPRLSVQHVAPYGSALVAVVDPDLDLPTACARTSAADAPRHAPAAPVIVVGEGPDGANHTLVRVLGPHGIAQMQFLAYPPSVRGGVSVCAARTASGAARIATCPIADSTERGVRIYDLWGLPTATVTPDKALQPPFAVATGNFLPGLPGDELAIVSGQRGRLYTLEGQPLQPFTIPGRHAHVSISRAANSAGDELVAYAPGAKRAYVLSFPAARSREVRVSGLDRADGVYLSAFGHMVAVGPDASRSRVVALKSRSSGKVIDVGAYENLFWFQWYRPTSEGKHVRASDFAHLRTDLATDFGSGPARASDKGTWSDQALVRRYGTKGGFAGYLVDRPKLWEPCFTHRQPKGFFERWIGDLDPDTGLARYPMLTRNGRPVEYGEFGSIDFYASTYAYGLPAIDNLYLVPLRAFLRKLIVPFREKPEHCAGLEPNHEHEIAVEADGSMGDYNLQNVAGFHDYLMRVYGGSTAELNRAMGTSFGVHFDAPRNWGRGSWDAYDTSNPFYAAWVEYNRYVVARRVAETFREALLAGFPPEIIKCHQIPDTYAIGNLQAFSDVTARFTPIDWMLNAGVGYGFTRYGVWYDKPHDALQDAHSSGFDAMSIGEYQALTPDPETAYRQLRFMFDNGCASAHCMLWPTGHDRGYNDTMHQALDRLIAEDPPRPGFTGGVGQIRPVSANGRAYDIACIGTGPNRTGLLKSLNADGSWEGSVYVVPFHAHVAVQQERVPAGVVIAPDRPLALGPFKDMDSGEQIEVVCRARTPATPGVRRPEHVDLTFGAERDGRRLPGLEGAVRVTGAWRTVRLVLRNQLPVTDIRLLIGSVAGSVELRDLRVYRESECTAKLTKGRFGGTRHRGSVTFDVMR